MMKNYLALMLILAAVMLAGCSNSQHTVFSENAVITYTYSVGNVNTPEGRGVLTIDKNNATYQTFTRGDNKLLASYVEPTRPDDFQKILNLLNEGTFVRLNEDVGHSNPDVGSAEINVTEDGFTKSVHNHGLGAPEALLSIENALNTYAKNMTYKAVNNSVPSGASPLVITESDNGKSRVIPLGSKVSLVLHSTYWEIQGSSDSSVMAQKGDSVLVPDSISKSVPGSGAGTITTEFQAIWPGTADIVATRVTCGEALRCSPENSLFNVTVVVK